VFPQIGIEAQQQLSVFFRLSLEAKQLAFVQVEKTGGAGRIRALRNHRSLLALGK